MGGKEGEKEKEEREREREHKKQLCFKTLGCRSLHNEKLLLHAQFVACKMFSSISWFLFARGDKMGVSYPEPCTCQAKSRYWNSRLIAPTFTLKSPLTRG